MKPLLRTCATLLCVAAFGAAAPVPAAAQDAARSTLNLPPPADSAAAPDLRSGSVQFIGNATVIVRYAGFTILTDPNFLHKGEHVHLGYGLKSTRLTDPAIPIDKLPPIDLVLLSHYHGDHFDPVAEARLDKALPVITTPAAVQRLREHGFHGARGLGTWQSITVTKAGARVKITAMPARHGPPLIARALPSVMGSMLEFESADGVIAQRMYISGDTLVHGDLEQIPERFPGIDLALLHLGGTRVLGLLVTMDAEQGVEALRIIDPALAIPIHYDDYDVFKSPLADFIVAARAAGLHERLRVLRHGETHHFEVPSSRLVRR